MEYQYCDYSSMSFQGNGLAGMLHTVAKNGSAAIAKNLRELRGGREWTQDALQDFGFAQNTISKYESGSIMPSAPALLRLARAYQVPIARLLRGVDQSYDELDDMTPAGRPVVLQQTPSQPGGGADVFPAADARVVASNPDCAQCAEFRQVLSAIRGMARTAERYVDRAIGGGSRKTTRARKAGSRRPPGGSDPGVSS